MCGLGPLAPIVARLPLERFPAPNALDAYARHRATLRYGRHLPTFRCWRTYRVLTPPAGLLHAHGGHGCHLPGAAAPPPHAPANALHADAHTMRCAPRDLSPRKAGRTTLYPGDYRLTRLYMAGVSGDMATTPPPRVGGGFIVGFSGCGPPGLVVKDRRTTPAFTVLCADARHSLYAQNTTPDGRLLCHWARRHPGPLRPSW